MQKKKDLNLLKLSFACLAILVEFAINDPILVLECAGTDWIVRAVVGPGATNQTLATLVCRVLLKWLDTAEIRTKAKLHLVMEQIFAPLIDLGFFHQNQNELPKSDQPAMKINQILECVSTIFLSIFRSWTGVLSCGYVEENGDLASNSPFRLLHYLGLGTNVDITMVKIRNMVIDICCEFVDTPYATRKFVSWNDAVLYYSRLHLPDRYKTSLRDDFVVAEMECLQTSGAFHPDVVDCLMSFRAVASYILINVGLPQALARLIMASPDDPGGIKATLLLADMLRSGASFLPQDRRLMLLSAPSLVQAVSERIQYSAKLATGKSYDAQVTFPHSDNAMLLLNRLDQLNDTSFNRLSLESQLHNIELFVCGGKALDLENKNRERSTSQVSPEDRLEHLFTSEPEFFSKVTAKELDLTRLESIIDCLECDQGTLLTKHRYNDKLHSFYSRIFTIILPQNYRLVKNSSSFNAQIIKCICCAVKILVPLAKSEPYYGELIERFLHQFSEQLNPEVLYKGVFSPKNILNTCAHYYFAVLAAIGSSQNGIQLLEDAGILQM
uniref:Rapamycin-insensitive companion of mTOR N-terminal domain-containing protein n=1 Tax=Panagrolaimus superbus TaxID=310955 RepID=A0A914Z9A0_9BILA